jgi:hypothetical protein
MRLTCRTSLRTSLPYLNVFLPGAALGEVGSASSVAACVKMVSMVMADHATLMDNLACTYNSSRQQQARSLA